MIISRILTWCLVRCWQWFQRSFKIDWIWFSFLYSRNWLTCTQSQRVSWERRKLISTVKSLMDCGTLYIKVFKGAKLLQGVSRKNGTCITLFCSFVPLISKTTLGELGFQFWKFLVLKYQSVKMRHFWQFSNSVSEFMSLERFCESLGKNHAYSQFCRIAKHWSRTHDSDLLWWWCVLNAEFRSIL